MGYRISNRVAKVAGRILFTAGATVFVSPGLNIGGTAFAALAESAPGAALNASVRRISPKRTVVLLDLKEGGGLRQDAVVSFRAGEDAEGTGVVKKLTRGGRILVRLAKPLPANVEDGASVAVTVVQNGTGGEVMASGSMGSAKSLMSESSISGLHTTDGTSAKAEVSVGSTMGALKISGGSANESVEMKHTAREYTFDSQAGYSTGSIGGGLVLKYQSAAASSKADISTTSTGSKDEDKIGSTSSGYAATPFLLGGTNSVTAALGFQVSRQVTERVVTIAGSEAPHDPVRMTENGVLLDVSRADASYVAGVSVSPGLAGKIKEDGQADVDHKAQTGSVYYAVKGGSMPYRVDLTLRSSSDGYTTGDLKSGAYGILLQTETTWDTWRLAPAVGMSMGSSSLGDQSGSFWKLRAGSRIELPGTMPSFAGIDFDYGMETEKAAGTKPEYKTSTFAFGLSGGIRI